MKKQDYSDSEVLMTLFVMEMRKLMRLLLLANNVKLMFDKFCKVSITCLVRLRLPPITITFFIFLYLWSTTDLFSVREHAY